MLRKAGILALAVALGAGAALGVAGCGEERGGVTVEGGTGTTGTAGTTTSPTAPSDRRDTTGR